ncbi:MAG: hypothetical protein AABZ39_03840 [Spirochaetota bacterium]
MKTVLSILVMLGTVVSLSAQCPNAAGKCAPNTTDVKSDTKELRLTIKELAAFNGKNGKSAYVAVDGIIYDVSGVEAWKDGAHKEGKAGTDISALIRNAPHKITVLGKRTVVGSIIAEPVKKNTK